MKSNTLAKIFFYHVKDNAAKIQLICTKGEESFKQEKRLLIVVPTFQAAQYVDTLLWRASPESFLPHAIVDTSTSEWITITLQEKHNVNQASRLLNLSTNPSPLYQQVEEIYELYDETHPQKAEFSQQRLKFYQDKDLFIRKFACV